MKVVIDTNVLISGFFFGGLPAKILSYWGKGYFKTVISKEIILEYARVLEYINRKYPEIEAKELLEIFILNSEIIDTTGIKIDICKDKDDNKFIECAFIGNCKYIISGDKHLLDIKEFNGIKILTPRDFLENLLE